ncbi:YceI family protein [Adhaeribacter sp. BT258]|uniref:YceI family protein n=1 Tax=Adhaeribacter terrigena TaxID=2793070 RepID=A0ABS1C4A2_9BACT|nr:YceI family protein [Adhaeribacter terrigena]MBK0404002.1 YceI family protein [Adhaeribacter terrigena]
MKKILRFLLIGFLLALGSRKLVIAQIIPSQSKVTFSISHMGGTVDGTITGMQGTVNFDENNLAASNMQATVDAATVNTENRARDSDLRKEKFFDAERYPQIKFQSKSFAKTAQGYKVTGDLTIKDRTHEVTIPFQREQQGSEVVYSGNITLNRKDYNLGKSAFPPMGKTVKVHILAVTQ